MLVQTQARKYTCTLIMRVRIHTSTSEHLHAYIHAYIDTFCAVGHDSAKVNSHKVDFILGATRYGDSALLTYVVSMHICTRICTCML
jgi:hypothetical protein